MLDIFFWAVALIGSILIAAIAFVVIFRWRRAVRGLGPPRF
jgi:hypothetical protein